MEIEVLEMEERRARFILRNSSPAMANALRRTLINDIPKMAIDKVEFHLGPIMDDDGEKEYESATPLFDEIIAHRLGMIPIPTLDYFVPQDECTCGGEGCPSCKFMYSLNKHGPCMVLSGDLMPLGDPDMKVVDENIPIVLLEDNQAVMIYATAVMGTAAKHVKWQVCNGVGYTYLATVSVPKGKEAALEYLVRDCPDRYYRLDGNRLTILDTRWTRDILAHVDYPDEEFRKEFDDVKFEVEYDDKDFAFSFETDGSMTAQKALDKAASILVDELRAFKSQIEVLETQ